MERESLVREVSTNGQIIADESKIEHVHVKVNGFIDQVYVSYIGEAVRKGQPLFTLYSPDLVSTQEEYLIAKHGEKSMGSSQFAEVSQGISIATPFRPGTSEAMGHQRRADQETGRNR